MIYLVLAFFLLFVFLAFRNFRLSLGLFIIGLPAYLLRVSIGPLPGTVLELFFWAIFLVWLAKYAKSDWQNLKQIIKKYFWLFVFISLFVLLINQISSKFFDFVLSSSPFPSLNNS